MACLVCGRGGRAEISGFFHRQMKDFGILLYIHIISYVEEGVFDVDTVDTTPCSGIGR
jgi:hypothetical protein